MTSERTLLFADLVNSTSLVARLGDADAARFWAEHDHRARELLARLGGQEIDRSDGFFLLFDRVGDALRFATQYHRLAAALGVSARIGLHHAQVALRRNPRHEVDRGAKPVEVEGLAKPLAARIMALADGATTLLSRDAAARLDVTDLEERMLHSHGHYRFKGFPDPVEVIGLARSQMACPPPADSEKGYRVVNIDGLWRPLRAIRHNLAPERDAFIGRDAELSRLAGCLDAGERLVSVLGTGGAGKTRLARHYAAAWLGEWPGGAYFCDLSEAKDLTGIERAVAMALGVPLGRDEALAQLGYAIAGRGRCLVILDNFEQVNAHAQATVGTWLDLATDAHFVVTSRERLYLAGEVVVALDPLPLGDEAITLFAARARAQHADFVIDDSNQTAVAEIVRLLDGLPLAIELAAARVRILSPAQIVTRLRDRFTVLAGARGVAARQTTLRAAIDWSWDLLAPWERSALAQCSVFEGRFTLEAAEAVISLDDSGGAPGMLDAIQALVDKSLVRTWQPEVADRPDIAEPFFGMYLSIHEYAAERLRALGQQVVAETERRHARYFAGFGSDDGLEGLLRHGGVARRRTLALEFDNLVCACRRAVSQREADLAAGCFLAAWAVLEIQGPYRLATTLGQLVAGMEGLRVHLAALVEVALAQALRLEGRTAESERALERALEVARLADDQYVQAIAWRERAVACHRKGRVAEALVFFQTAISLHEALNDRLRLGMLRANLANLQMEMGQMADALMSYDAAIALHREVGNRAAEGIAIGNLGTLHHELGRSGEARRSYDQALGIHDETGNLHQQAITLYNLGVLAAQEGEHGQAAANYRAALAIHRDTGNRRGEGVVLGQMGELHQGAGELQQAFEQYDAALRIHREVGNRRFEGGVLGNLGALLAERGQKDAGIEALRAGELVLRELDDPLDLAKLLCVKGRVALTVGDATTSRSALAEARAIANQLGAEAQSELGREIDGLRDLLR